MYNLYDTSPHRPATDSRRFNTLKCCTVVLLLVQQIIRNKIEEWNLGLWRAAACLCESCAAAHRCTAAVCEVVRHST